jgi:hypothetical protein
MSGMAAAYPNRSLSNASMGIVRLAEPDRRGSLLGMTASPNPYRGFRFPAEIIEHASGCITASA